MIQFIKDLFKHKCNFEKPLLSQYRTFHSRAIVYECKCGKRKIFRVDRDFSDPFPIETGFMITDEQMNNCVNNLKN